MMTKRILFRCDGGSIPELGTGHLVRCFILANELLKNAHAVIAFLMGDNPESIEKTEKQGFQVYVIKHEQEEDFRTIKTIIDFKPDIFVRDRLNSSAELMNLVKHTGIILITIDDLGEGAEFADITINPILHNGKALYEGYQYLVLPGVPDAEWNRIGNSQNPKVFAFFGGYDYLDITQQFLRCIQQSKDVVEYHIVVGDLYDKIDLLREMSSNNENINIYQSPEDFSTILKSCDLAVVSGGLTLFQAVAYGIPSMVISQYKHQLDNAEKLQNYGAAQNLGLFKLVDFSNLVQKIKALIVDEDKRKEMSNKGRYLIDGLGTREVSSIIGIIDRLEWDSDFFCKNIAYLYPKRLRESIVKFAFKKCQEEDIDCLYYLCNCHDPESVRIAEEYGFHFVDIRLTYEMSIDPDSYVHNLTQIDDLQIRESCPKDIPVLSKIAQTSYMHSRYYFDRHFSTEHCQRFYRDWIVKSTKGKFDDIVFVTLIHDQVAGFISCQKTTPNMGKIGLVGISQDFQGQGLGRHLVQKAIEWFRKENLPFVEVVTQGRNLNAQKLYQSCGFTSKRTELWYHKWFTKKYID